MIELRCPSRPNAAVTIEFAVITSVTVQYAARFGGTIEPGLKTSFNVDYGAVNIDFGSTGAEGQQLLIPAESVGDAVPNLPRSQL